MYWRSSSFHSWGIKTPKHLVFESWPWTSYNSLIDPLGYTLNAFHLEIIFNRSRSRSRSRTPARSRRHDYGSHADNGYRSKSKPPKIEYITEFAVSIGNDDPKMEAISPPSSPVQADPLNRSGHSTFYTCKDILANLFSLPRARVFPEEFKIKSGYVGQWDD